MDILVWAAIAALVLISWIRFQHTRSKVRTNRERGEEIQRRLAELRKQKEEQTDPVD